MISSVFVVWRDSKTSMWHPVAKLTRTQDGYRFNYTKGAINKKFKPFVFMDRLASVYEGEELPPFFANRVIGKERPEFKKVNNWSDLVFDGENYLDILGRTGGGRVTDEFRIVPCPVEKDGKYSLKFFVNGIRYLDESQQVVVNKLLPGDELEFVKEDSNSYDQMALRIDQKEGVQIGYCPRYLSPEFRRIIEDPEIEGYTLKVSKNNQDAPSAFKILCEFSSHWPKDHRPMVSDEYLAILND